MTTAQYNLPVLEVFYTHDFQWRIGDDVYYSFNGEPKDFNRSWLTYSALSADKTMIVILKHKLDRNVSYYLGSSMDTHRSYIDLKEKFKKRMFEGRLTNQ